MVQWLGPGVFTVMVPHSIPGQGTKILQAVWFSQIKNKNRNLLQKGMKKDEKAKFVYGLH